MVIPQVVTLSYYADFRMLTRGRVFSYTRVTSSSLKSVSKANRVLKKRGNYKQKALQPKPTFRGSAVSEIATKA